MLQPSTPLTQRIMIEVVYNGITKSLEVEPRETVQAALAQALDAFVIRDQRHIMAFFREDGSEVTPDTISLEAAHVTAGAVLALRPSRVKGGVA